MSIQHFPPTAAGETAARAVADPKNLVFAAGQWEVRDGTDYVAPRPLSQDEQDADAARQYAKLRALTQMTPAQVQAWVAANVTNLAQAQDAIATLAIGMSILGRRL